MKRGIYIFLLLTAHFCFAQTRKTDSLLKVIKTQKQDTSRVRSLHQLCMEFVNTDPEKALEYNKEAAVIALKVNDKKGLGNAYHVFGLIYYNKGIPDSCIHYHLKALEIRRKVSSPKNICMSIGNIGTGYMAKGDYKKALSYLLDAVKAAEEMKDSVFCANYYNNLGLVYKNLNDDENALNYFKRSFEIKKLKSDQRSQANTILNIGLIHHLRNETALAIGWFEDALDKFTTAGYSPGQAICYNNLGAAYYDLSRYDDAVEANLKSLKIKEQLGDMYGCCSSYINLGSDYYAKGNISKAKEYHLKALELAEAYRLMEQKPLILFELSKESEAVKDHAKALMYYKKMVEAKDSLFNLQKLSEITEIQTRYDTEKKDKEIVLQNAELKERSLQTKHAKTQRNAFIIGFLLVVVLAVFAFVSYRQKKKDNAEIVKQKHIIQEQKQEVEVKNKEITDSITYAQRIQKTLMASHSMLQKELSDYFILFRPKDIVSGDFYWATTVNVTGPGLKASDSGTKPSDNPEHETTNQKLFYLAVCDCTGHGVPGAFMSLLNISFLNEAVSEKGIYQPDRILGHVRQRLIHSLAEDGSEGGGKDGMDCSLMCFEKKGEQTVLHYSCAHNKLIHVRGNELTELSADKMPVGRSPRDTQRFSLHSLELKKGDMIYALTDGYGDQFGGDKGKKFKHKQILALLQLHAQQSTASQKSVLENNFEEWKGKLEQVDDVLVIGIRL